MKEDNLYWVDDNNNRWSKRLYTKEQAEQLSKTLANCTNCTDCSHCNGCNDCSNCRHCINCTNCSGCATCNHCNYCRYCRYCNDCRDCNHCSYCYSCIFCSACSNCSRCRDCNYCLYCSYCSGFRHNPQRIVSDRIGSRSDTTTIYYYDNKYHVVCGCFTCSLEEFKTAIKNTHGENKHAVDYFRFIEKVESYFNKQEAK